jgi:hypothetical protein
MILKQKQHRMKKKIAKFSVLPVLGASVFFYSFSAKRATEMRQAIAAEFSTAGEELLYSVPDAPETMFIDPATRVYPSLGKSYLAFKEALGFKESGGDYTVINDFGYLGKYQFGKGTLKMIGIRDTNLFLDNPDLQEAAFYANASRNKWILRRDIDRFQDKVINGITITESGILAAAHLAGAGNVKKFLRSGGSQSFNDGFGTSIKHYFKKFGGYDTSFVVPERTAKIKNPSAV